MLEKIAYLPCCFKKAICGSIPPFASNFCRRYVQLESATVVPVIFRYNQLRPNDP